MSSADGPQFLRARLAFVMVELLVACSLGRATAAGTEISKVIVCINTGAMTVLPAQLDRVIADPADFLELSVRHIDKASLGAMALAKRARTIPTQIRLRILTHVTILPCDADNST
jgi:hypothetical protein